MLAAERRELKEKIAELELRVKAVEQKIRAVEDKSQKDMAERN